MGDIVFAGAPFVITLPENWDIYTTEYGYRAESPHDFGTYIAATEVFYSVTPETTLDSAINDFFPYGPYQDSISGIINGMDFAIYMTEVGITPSNMPTLETYTDPETGQEKPLNSIFYHTVVFAYNQQYVLTAAIETSTPITTESLFTGTIIDLKDEFINIPLLIISGIWPAPTAKDIVTILSNPLNAEIFKDPVQLRKLFKKIKPIIHAGHVREVSVRREYPFGKVPAPIKEKLDEVSRKITRSKQADEKSR